LDPSQSINCPTASILIRSFRFAQWEFLSKELVSEYQEELKGAAQGGLAAGLSRLYPLDKVLARVILLANLPGTVRNLRSGTPHF
jgi:hypothetical protein